MPVIGVFGCLNEKGGTDVDQDGKWKTLTTLKAHVDNSDADANERHERNRDRRARRQGPKGIWPPAQTPPSSRLLSLEWAQGKVKRVDPEEKREGLQWSLK